LINVSNVCLALGGTCRSVFKV